MPPPTLVGDVGGGSLYLAIGLLAGVLRARETGEGTVVDAAIVDGSAHMMNLLYSLRAAGGLPDERGDSMLDGAHFYRVYQCADEQWISIGPLEPKFYGELLERLGLQNDAALKQQFKPEEWDQMRDRFEHLFKSKPRQHWIDLLHGTDVCFAPVLSPAQAAQDEHIKSREVLRTIDGVLQAAAAPRFDGKTPADPRPAPHPGQHTEEILSEIGVDDRDIAKWRDTGALKTN